MSWEKKEVRHSDGRAGVIKTEVDGFAHKGLFIECKDGSKAYVQLNSFGPDTGEKGWQWFCEEFDKALGGPQWMALGG